MLKEIDSLLALFSTLRWVQCLFIYIHRLDVDGHRPGDSHHMPKDMCAF